MKAIIECPDERSYIIRIYNDDDTPHALFEVNSLTIWAHDLQVIKQEGVTVQVPRSHETN